MEPFRPVRGGGARAWLAAAEACLLRSLVSQIMALVEPEDFEDRPEPEPDDELAALEAMVYGPGADQPPEDPVLARLLPDGYRDDPAAAGEFRKYTEPALRSAKHQAAREMLDKLPGAGGRIQLTQDQALSWLKALNDVRLALGVRLGVTEDFEQQWGRLKPDDPQWTAFEVYAWLGAVQESLVQALKLSPVSSSIMLTISRALYDKIVAHARADHPDEACGVIAGPAGSDRPERFIAMMNAERSPTFYRFDSAAQFLLWREMDDHDEEPVVIYHSHTATEAYPSRTDISYASEPQPHYA